MRNLIVLAFALVIQITLQAQLAVNMSPSNESMLANVTVEFKDEFSNVSEVYLLFSGMDSGVICQGSEVSLSASPSNFSYYYFYHDGKLIQRSNSPNLKIENVNAGIHVFKVQAVNGNGFITSKELMFEVSEEILPMISIGGTTSLTPGESVMLIASFGRDYVWSTGEKSQSIRVSKPGSYEVKVTDVNGCAGKSNSIQVEMTKPVQSISVKAEHKSISPK